MKPVILGLAVLLGAATAFAQTPVTNRIPQQIVINGQAANGAYVLTPTGSIQNYTCSAPQTYSTPDGASHGWACLESTTGTWLLGALPPQAAVAQPVPVQPPMIQPVYQPVYQPVVVQPAVVYQPVVQPPAVVYQQVIAQPSVVYVNAPPAVVYRSAPTVVYAQPPRTVVVNAYPSPNVIIGAATIQAAGRVTAAAIGHSRTIEVIDHRGGGGGHRR